MSILKIAKMGHPVLLKKSNEINEFSTDLLKKIVYDMSETMIDYSGIGLAAPQVHLSMRVIVFRNPDIDDQDKIKVTPLINPVFSPIGEEKENDWEGCLSIPGMSGLVRRYKKIKYSALDLNGKNVVNEVEGLRARIIQHEFDHLNGILYTSRLVNKNAFGYSEEIEKFWKKPSDANSK